MQKNSGTYIIQSLCHYLDSTKSVTSLEVIRDSYGLSFQRDESGDDSGRLLKDGKGLIGKPSEVRGSSTLNDAIELGGPGDFVDEWAKEMNDSGGSNYFIP